MSESGMEKQGQNQRICYIKRIFRVYLEKLLKCCVEEIQTIERDDDDDDDGSNSMDRISELPQGILHHILSFLSQKQAVQTCVLSKSWRYVWSTRPKIDFYEHCFYGNRETFMFALDKTLQGYHDQKLYIQEFRVWMSIVDPKSISLLEKWIPKIVIDMRVKTFKLYLHSNKREYFDLPSVVFKAESLQKLYMHRCKLSQNPLDKVLFKHLQTLSLTLVYIVDETFEKIMSSCPLIENLFLESCKGLKTVKVNKGCNLKDFVWLIDGDGDDCSVEFNTPTLETIKFIGIVNWFHRHNKYFPHLKSLYLSKVRLASWSSDMFSCNYMPTLEELTIRYCFDFKEFQLSNNSIKNLTIASLQDPTNKFVIDAPNIVKFDYVGYISPSIVFATTSSEWKSDICVCYDVDFDDNDASSSWFFKLNKLLKALSQSEISLDLYQYRGGRRNRHIADNYGGFCELVVVEHLCLRIYYLSSSFPAFLNCLFRICRPRNIGPCWYDDEQITGYKSEDMQITEFLCKNLLIRGRKRRHYVWQQDLEEVSLETFDENGHRIRGTRLFACPKNQHRPDKLCFRLKWREI